MAPECIVQCIRCREKAPSLTHPCFFLDKVKIGTQYTRKEGYLCSKCSCLDYRKIHEIGEDKEEILPGDVRDNFRVLLRCRIKTRALDSDIMNDHDEKVNEYEEYLDQFQRDQMIVKGYNLYPTSDDVDCKQFEKEWDDDGQDLMLLEVANGQ